MNYEILVAGMNQDEINEIYINWEIRWNKLCGRYFSIRASKWKDERAEKLHNTLLDRMGILARCYNSDSLPF